MNLFNYPVVVYPAPKREYGGHSAFVTNVRWLHRLEMDLALATVGRMARRRIRPVVIARRGGVGLRARRPGAAQPTILPVVIGRWFGSRQVQ